MTSNAKKFPVGTLVKHRLTGREGEVRQVFGADIWLAYSFEGRLFRDWFPARGFDAVVVDTVPAITSNR